MEIAVTVSLPISIHDPIAKCSIHTALRIYTAYLSLALPDPLRQRVIAYSNVSEERVQATRYLRDDVHAV